MANGSGQIDSTVHVVTPENIAFQYQAAGPFRRFPAFLIDVVIKLWMVATFSWFTTWLSGFAGLPGVGIGISAILYFVFDWFYGGFCETYMNGQTPGKWLLGIRVLTTRGQPINGLQAVMRNVMRTVELMPLVSLEVLGPIDGQTIPAYIIPTFMVGLIAMSCNRRYQRLGDLVCNTIVIVEEKHWLTGVAKLEDPRTVQLAAYLPLDFQVGRSLAKALSHYVDRRRFFSVARRREVAKWLAAPLLDQFGLPADTSHDLLLCSLYYRTFIADQRDDDRHLEESFGSSPFARTMAEAAAHNTHETAGVTPSPLAVDPARATSTMQSSDRP